mgnify:CR=1 FL=1
MVLLLFSFSWWVLKGTGTIFWSSLVCHGNDWGLNLAPPALEASTLPLGYQGGLVWVSQSQIGLWVYCANGDDTVVHACPYAGLWQFYTSTAHLLISIHLHLMNTEVN